MGLPIGWVSPNCTNPLLIEQMNLDFSEMALSQEPQNEQSKLYGNKSTKNWPTPLTTDGERTGLANCPEHWEKRNQEKGFKVPMTLNIAVNHSELWGTPTVMDSHAIKRSVVATIKQATKGARKGRTSSSNLAEQVVYPITTEIYLLVKDYYETMPDGDVETYVSNRLKNWSTPTAMRNGNDLISYLGRKIRARSGDAFDATCSLQLEVEMVDLGYNFNANNLSLEELKQVLAEIKAKKGRD